MTDNPIADVLDRATDILTPEGAWTQGASYRDADGNVVDGDQPSAVCCCTIGAINKASNFHFSAAELAWEFLAGCLHLSMALEEWNDAPERTQAEVLAALRQASALAREQGK